MNHTLILHHLWPLTSLRPLLPSAWPVGHSLCGIYLVLQVWPVVSPATTPFPLLTEPHLDRLLMVALPSGRSEPSRWSYAPAVVQTWASRMPEGVCCTDFWKVCVFFKRDTRLECSFITVAGEGVRR